MAALWAEMSYEPGLLPGRADIRQLRVDRITVDELRGLFSKGHEPRPPRLWKESVTWTVTVRPPGVRLGSAITPPSGLPGP
jgi:hypothetical protein